jgi:hypothetical protein
VCDHLALDEAADALAEHLVLRSELPEGVGHPNPPAASGARS